MYGYSKKTFLMIPVKTEGLNFEVRHKMPSREVLRKNECSGYKKHASDRRHSGITIQNKLVNMITGERKSRVKVNNPGNLHQ